MNFQEGRKCGRLKKGCTCTVSAQREPISRRSAGSTQSSPASAICRGESRVGESSAVCRALSRMGPSGWSRSRKPSGPPPLPLPAQRIKKTRAPFPSKIVAPAREVERLDSKTGRKLVAKSELLSRGFTTRLRVTDVAAPFVARPSPHCASPGLSSSRFSISRARGSAATRDFRGDAGPWIARRRADG